MRAGQGYEASRTWLGCEPDGARARAILSEENLFLCDQNLLGGSLASVLVNQMVSLRGALGARGALWSFMVRSGRSRGALGARGAHWMLTERSGSS